MKISKINCTNFVERFILTGEMFQLQDMWQKLQEIVYIVNTPTYPLRHTALPLPVLWEKIPSEVRHEKTYIHPYR